VDKPAEPTIDPVRTETPPQVLEQDPLGRARRRRKRRGVRWRRRVTVAGLSAIVVALPLPLDDLPPPIHVTVGDVVRSLTPGTTLEAVRIAEGLHPLPGDFVDVEKVVLDAGRYPGHLAVNGEPAEGGRVLIDDDVVEVVDGTDRVEELVRSTVRVPGGRVANPQASLATAPGQQITTRGKVSGKLVSSVFRPTGPYTAPLQVALTFDDGPSPTFTPRILDILKRFNVRATFFVVGTLVERYPGLVRRMIREGHTIGNHTYAHPIGGSFARRPRKEIREEMDRAQRLLQDLGIRPVGFRPPGGSWSDFVREEAELRGMRTVLWAVDSRDWTRPPANAVVNRVLRDARPGAIILLHDGGGDRSNTVDALGRIIKGLRNRGLEPVAIT
jgi:peptidoglycan/xylan/chitin deacetylase (PgdA/CDA1 family)